MTSAADAFRALHHGDELPLLLANAWDPGSAKVLAALGYRALATTSGGYANALGRVDGSLSRDEALAHAADLAAATDLPVSADLEHGFGADIEAVEETARGAVAAGLAGFSIEDWDPDEQRCFEIGRAAERIAAAAEIAHGDGAGLVLTARADNYFHAVADLDDTIARLVAFAEAGADVLYAPAVTAAGDIERIIGAVDRPVNVLVIPGVPPIAELRRVGVARVSVGTGFSLAALGGLITAASELRDAGTYGFWQHAGDGQLIGRAFESRR